MECKSDDEHHGYIAPMINVTRLGDFLHFGQPFKDGGKNYFTQIAYIIGNFCKGAKIHHFSSEIIFGQLL